MTAVSPLILRYVSCWPAKLASGRSSAVALDRTATIRSLVAIFLYEVLTSSFIAAGIFAFITSALMVSAAFSRAALFSTSIFSETLKIFWSRPVSTRNLRNAWAVTTNAGGTGRPIEAISPRDAPLPPTDEISSFLISSSHSILGTSFMLAPLMISPPPCLSIIICQCLLRGYRSGPFSPEPRITLIRYCADIVWVFMAKARVLVSDPLAEEGLAILKEACTVDVKTDLKEDELCGVIGEYDALIVRSGTEVTAKVIGAGKRLRFIGRAGVGVDNVDVDAATRRGVIVANAPEGNTLAATEHTMAMMLSLARNIPQANASLKKKEWKRSKFMGVELNEKTLGIVGFGRIGREVAKRANAMDMKCVAYDPFISKERAAQLGVRVMSLEELFTVADVITVHTPLIKETKHVINAKSIATMKDGVRIINCARGGIIDEGALCDAIRCGKVAGAALDVFETEPPLELPLLSLENVIVTPHLGAST